jgi:fumarate hydratase subunit alpha
VNPDAELAALEAELLSRINALGIGPQGLGGHTTALGVLIEQAPCHIASLPLAVNVECHSHRHGVVRL